MRGAGEAALRRDRELLERRILGRLVDARDHGGLVFELARLRRDNAEHDRLRAVTTLGQEAQRLEGT